MSTSRRTRGYGTDPKEWGRPFWAVMYTVSRHYPSSPSEDEQRGAQHFYESLGHLLPCDECKGHYRQILTELPVQTKNREELRQWLKLVEDQVKVKSGNGGDTDKKKIKKQKKKRKTKKRSKRHRSARTRFSSSFSSSDSDYSY